MATHEIPKNQQKIFEASYKKCSELLHKIFNEESQFLQHELQFHSDEAHKAKRELYKELDDIMSYELLANMSPPSIKTRSPGRQYSPLSSRKRRRNKGPHGTLRNNGNNGNNGNS